MLKQQIHFCLAIILFSILSAIPFTTQAQVSSSPDSLIVDGQSFKFGDAVTFEGRYLGDVYQGYGFARIEVLRVNGRATLQSLEFHLVGDRERFEGLLEQSKSFSFSGSIVNARLGPKRVCNFQVKSVAPIKDNPLEPKEFVGRDVTFEGVAQPGELPVVNFLHSETPVQLVDPELWKASLAGKLLSVSGAMVQLSDKQFAVKNPKWKLVDLKDQVDKVVELAGFLQSLNGHWWFNYGEDRVVLLSSQGPQLNFSGAAAHGRRVTVKGQLVKQLRPSLDQISLKSDRDLVPTFVVKDAKVQFDEAPKSWTEKYGTLPSSVDKSKQGVPVLVPETAFRRNLLGTETTIQLFYERNRNSIVQILELPPAEVQPVLVNRLEAEDVDQKIKLLYAAILARIKAPAGRDYLLKALSQSATKSSEAIVEDGEVFQVYFALGIFPFLGDQEPASPVDLAWIEPTMIRLLEGKYGKEIVTYSSIPYVLAQAGTSKAKKALFDFAMGNTERSDHFFSPDSVTRILCAPDMKLNEAELLQLYNAYKDSGIRRRLFQALLRLGSPKAAELYLASGEDDDYYGDLESSVTPAIKERLEKALPSVKSIGKRNEIRMAMCLADEDPVPGLIELINDPTFTNKNFIFYSMVPMKDPRIVAPTLKMLKTAPDDYWEKSLAPFPLESALTALGKVGGREAFAALVELLPEKLDRFEDSEFIDRAGWRRIIAGHLIEMSGESFGTDEKKWQAWLNAHPDHPFHAEAESDSLSNATNGSIDFGR